MHSPLVIVGHPFSVLAIVFVAHLFPSTVLAPPTLEECIIEAWDQKILSEGTDWRSTRTYTARQAGEIGPLFDQIIDRMNAQSNRQISLDDFTSALGHVLTCFEVSRRDLKYQASDAFRMCGGWSQQSGSRDGPRVPVMPAVNFFDAVLLALYGEQYIRAKAAGLGAVVIKRSAYDRLFPNGKDGEGRVVFQ